MAEFIAEMIILLMWFGFTIGTVTLIGFLFTGVTDGWILGALVGFWGLPIILDD